MLTLPKDDIVEHKEQIFPQFLSQKAKKLRIEGGVRDNREFREFKEFREFRGGESTKQH